jgi:hypothetical protein
MQKLFAIVVPVLFTSASFTPPQHGRTIHIEAFEYAYRGVPATLAPGLSIFEFENRGNMNHEMIIQRLRRGVSADSAMRLLAHPPAPPLPALPDSAVEPGIGILLARPHSTTSERLEINGKSGDVYVLRCTLRDKPDAPRHLELGMFAAMTVK